MTDRYKVYTKVLKVLKEMLSLSHPGHILTLAMLIARIVTSRKAQLSAVSAETATKAKDKSTEMRLRRWVHKSHLADPDRLSRLLLAACMAYLWMVCQGLLVIADKKVGLIDRTDRIDKSLFRLGLDWIHYSLKSAIDFTPIFRFHPGFLRPDVR